MRYLSAALCALVIAVSFAGSALADGKAFPPSGHCGSDQPYLSFLGSGDTVCSTGQEIMKNALTCGANQQLAYDGTNFICRTVPTCTANQSLSFNGANFVCRDNNVPTCNPGSFLSFDGTNYECKSTGVTTCASNQFLSYNGSSYECKSTGVATCGADQVLTFNGSSYYCVNRDAAIPTCGANQFLTYNGSYQCAAVNTPSVPSCASNQVVKANGSQFYCDTAPNPLSGLKISVGGVDVLAQFGPGTYGFCRSEWGAASCDGSGGVSCSSGLATMTSAADDHIAQSEDHSSGQIIWNNAIHAFGAAGGPVYPWDEGFAQVYHYDCLVQN
jgi:hypothetical protein